jgi:hypothetical protein
MDCFVARVPRNDGETHFRILAARCARGKAKQSMERRAKEDGLHRPKGSSQ